MRRDSGTRRSRARRRNRMPSSGTTRASCLTRDTPSVWLLVAADAQAAQLDAESGVVALASDARREEVVSPLVAERRPRRRRAGHADVEPPEGDLPSRGGEPNRGVEPAVVVSVVE